jgi:hypothetical protein
VIRPAEPSLRGCSPLEIVSNPRNIRRLPAAAG